jgi:hypothetical protein
MRRRLLFILVCGVILSGCSLSSKKSGIEIVSYPNAKVFLDDKEAGMTPYNNRMMKTGEVKVKLTVGDNEWIKTVHTENGASTVINREFGPDADHSGGYLLYFESTGDKNKAGFLISTKPDRATIKIDDEVKGLSPLRIDNIGEGDKKLMISFPGYKNLNSFVKFINGYQLVVEADLAKEEVSVTPEIAESPETPISTISGTPAASVAMVTIKTTETGWLRVRDSASSVGVEVAKVYPKAEYKLLEENNGWYRIDLGNGKSGWISAKYADKKLGN